MKYEFLLDFTKEEKLLLPGDVFFWKHLEVQ